LVKELSKVSPIIFSQNFPRRRSFETLKREFELSDCLNFVKAGVEAIIEDQVTLRFEAEELKVCTKI
jgi:glycerol-3-phosphate O-acyltransferase 3/4